MCCRRMHDELRAVADSPRLATLVAKTVGKALQLMAEKAEYMAFAGDQPLAVLHSGSGTAQSTL